MFLYRARRNFEWPFIMSQLLMYQNLHRLLQVIGQDNDCRVTQSIV